MRASLRENDESSLFGNKADTILDTDIKQYYYVGQVSALWTKTFKPFLILYVTIIAMLFWNNSPENSIATHKSSRQPAISLDMSAYRVTFKEMFCSLLQN